MRYTLARLRRRSTARTVGSGVPARRCVQRDRRRERKLRPRSPAGHLRRGGVPDMPAVEGPVDQEGEKGGRRHRRPSDSDRDVPQTSQPGVGDEGTDDEDLGIAQGRSRSANRKSGPSSSGRSRWRMWKSTQTTSRSQSRGMTMEKQATSAPSTPKPSALSAFGPVKRRSACSRPARRTSMMGKKLDRTAAIAPATARANGVESGGSRASRIPPQRTQLATVCGASGGSVCSRPHPDRRSAPPRQEKRARRSPRSPLKAAGESSA